MPTPYDLISRMVANQTTEGGSYTITVARCSKCKRTRNCISEPKGSSWLCNECYSGLTSQQIAERMNDLGKMVEDKDFIPDWATWMTKEVDY